MKFCRAGPPPDEAEDLEEDAVGSESEFSDHEDEEARPQEQGETLLSDMQRIKEQNHTEWTEREESDQSTGSSFAALIWITCFHRITQSQLLTSTWTCLLLQSKWQNLAFLRVIATHLCDPTLRNISVFQRNCCQSFSQIKRSKTLQSTTYKLIWSIKLLLPAFAARSQIPKCSFQIARSAQRKGMSRKRSGKSQGLSFRS